MIFRNPWVIFFHDQNCAENDLIWDKYLHRHPTIVCSQFVKILHKRKNVEKLREFLNFGNLNKKRISASELRKAYSTLFDDLLYIGDNDAIIRIELPEFSQKNWSVTNNSPKTANLINDDLYQGVK